MNTTEKETLTVEDLDRVYIRVQDEDGSWHSRHAGEVTDQQFDAWASSRATILGSGAWPAEERAEFCNYLWQGDTLVLLTKEARDEFKEEAGA